MPDIAQMLMERFDRVVERRVRRAAQRSGRRGFMTGLGKAMVGGALLPMLPYDRGGAAALAATGIATGPDDDATDCEYWRYCAFDGMLCSECGGGAAECPPGSTVSSVSWIGTCRNPNDDRDYLVSYNDCCGKAYCNQATFCFKSERERPGYSMGLYNDINWCMADASKGYHCTVAAVVGVA